MTRIGGALARTALGTNAPTANLGFSATRELHRRRSRKCSDGESSAFTEGSPPQAA